MKKSSQWSLSFVLASLVMILAVPGLALFLFLGALVVSARLFPLPKDSTLPGLLGWLLLVWLVPALVLFVFWYTSSGVGLA